MIEVLIDDRKVEIEPNISIEKFQKISKNPIKYNDPYEMLALYLDMEKTELMDLPYRDVKFIENYISQNVITNDRQEIVFTFELDGVTYGFENDWKNMKWGQWVDMEIYSQKDRIVDNIHILMAILYRPVTSENGTKYTIEPYKSDEVLQRAEKFKSKVPVKIWLACSSFFLQISGLYISNIKSSLELKMKWNRRLEKMTKWLPKFLRPKPLPDSIFNLPTNFQEMTLPSSNK